MKSVTKIKFQIKKEFLFIVFLIIATSVGAQVTWNGSVDSDWNNADNWSSSAVPTTSDDVYISSSSHNPIISTAVEVLSLTIDSHFSISSTGSLSIDGVSNYSANAITILSGGFENEGTINLGLSAHAGLTNGILSQTFDGFYNFGTINTGHVGSEQGAVISITEFYSEGELNIGHTPSNAKGIISAFVSISGNLNLIPNDSIAIDILANGEGSFGGIVNVDLNGGYIRLQDFASFSAGSILTCSHLKNFGLNLRTNSAFSNQTVITGFQSSINHGNIYNYGLIYSDMNFAVSPNSIITTYGYLIQPGTKTSSCNQINNFAGGYASDIGLDIYLDANGTMSAGINQQGTFVPNFTLVDSTYNLFVKVENLYESCPLILPFQITVQLGPCCNSMIWNGDDNSNWINPLNWNLNQIPTSCNEVLIPVTPISPIVNTGVLSEILSLTLEPGATITINSAAELKILSEN